MTPRHWRRHARQSSHCGTNNRLRWTWMGRATHAGGVLFHPPPLISQLVRKCLQAIKEASCEVGLGMVCQERALDQG